MRKIIAIGCLGKPETFSRFWRKKTADLAKQPVFAKFDVGFAPGVRHAAGMYLDRDKQVIIKVCMPQRKKNLRLAAPDLKMVGCGK